MLTLIYRAIVLLFLVFIVHDFFKEKSVTAKISACMVIAPLALRLLLIK